MIHVFNILKNKPFSCRILYLLSPRSGKNSKDVCLFLMRFLNYLARAAATIFFKYVSLFLENRAKNDQKELKETC